MMLYLLSSQAKLELGTGGIAAMVGVTIGVSLGVIALDVFTRQKKIAALSGLFLGLLAGLIVAYAFSFVVDLVALLFLPEGDSQRAQAYANVLQGVKVFIGLVTTYLCTSIVLQTKDEIRFVIPYVEFEREFRGIRPTFVDTSVLIDGRIEELADTKVLPGPLLVPEFVVNELQGIADASDKLRRARGRRGLDILRKLQNNPAAELTIENADAQGATVDRKLVQLAKNRHGRVMTGDYNLAKVAELEGIEVINLNDVAKALRPAVIPGEPIEVELVQAGESPDQGVGYLQDGTMVVVENGRQRVGSAVEGVVTSTLQTSAGRMIFARLDGAGQAKSPAGSSGRSRQERKRAKQQRQREDQAGQPETGEGS